MKQKVTPYWHFAVTAVSLTKQHVESELLDLIERRSHYGLAQLPLFIYLRLNPSIVT